MGFWFSRSVRLGPFRLHLGSGGIGMSMSFGFFHFGINRRGLYVGASKAGLHYRRYLTGRREEVRDHGAP